MLNAKMVGKHAATCPEKADEFAAEIDVILAQGARPVVKTCNRLIASVILL